jgi:L-ascorbate metabolism protein UlaG (beta-lactamase superfamily)
VSGPLGHVGAFFRYLATARRQHASDRLTAHQLASAATVALPPGLELTWIGTAGFRLAYQGTVVWIDPYVTRLSLGDLLRRRVVRTADDVVAAHVDRAEAVLVGHTHFDHALDVPTIARRTGARVFGSSSSTHLMALHGLAAQAITVTPHADYEVGPFRFHFVPSIHSKLQLGLGVPYSGELTCDHLDGMTPQAYRCGQVWGIWISVAGITLYHQGSADLIEDEIRDRDIDILLCGISGRRFTDDYVARVVRALRPAAIIPHHFDDFFRPLDTTGGAPLKLSFNVNLTGFADEVHAASREVALRALPVAGAIAAS